MIGNYNMKVAEVQVAQAHQVVTLRDLKQNQKLKAQKICI